MIFVGECCPSTKQPPPSQLRWPFPGDGRADQLRYAILSLPELFSQKRPTWPLVIFVILAILTSPSSIRSRNRRLSKGAQRRPHAFFIQKTNDPRGHARLRATRFGALGPPYGSLRSQAPIRSTASRMSAEEPA